MDLFYVNPYTYVQMRNAVKISKNERYMLTVKKQLKLN